MSVPTSTSIRAPQRLCCYVGSSELGGMEASLASVLSRLSSNYEVTVLGVCEKVVQSIASRRPNTKVVIIPKVMGKKDLRSVAEHIKAIHSLKPNVVLASLAQLYDAQYAIVAAFINRVPLIAVVHCVLPSTSRLQRVLFRYLARRVAAFGGVSQAVCAAGEEALGLRSGTFSLLYNGVADVATNKFLVDRGGPTIGAVGRLVPEKGFDLAIKALAELPECRLAILGNGPLLNALQSLAREEGVLERVEFVGWVDPPWTAAWHFDVLVAPSDIEGFGLVVVEAMLAQIPVIASRIGGIQEIISQNETGILVPVRDSHALAEAIRKILRDESLRTGIIKRGRNEALNRFSLEIMVASYEDLLRKVHSH